MVVPTERAASACPLWTNTADGTPRTAGLAAAPSHVPRPTPPDGAGGEVLYLPYAAPDRTSSCCPTRKQLVLSRGYLLAPLLRIVLSSGGQRKERRRRWGSAPWVSLSLTKRGGIGAEAFYATGRHVGPVPRGPAARWRSERPGWRCLDPDSLVPGAAASRAEMQPGREDQARARRPGETTAWEGRARVGGRGPLRVEGSSKTQAKFLFGSSRRTPAGRCSS